jgi:hypothetical protein
VLLPILGVEETMKERPINASELLKLLTAMFCPPSYALISEVRDGTGYATAGRSMDAMAFGLWPSRGLEIIGFEMKISRSDWQRELKQPEKAEAFYKYLDRWYIVAGDESIVRAEELPRGWGLIVAKGEKLKFIVPCEVKKAKPIDRLFLMSIIRNFDKNCISKNVFEAKVAEAIEERIKRAVGETEYEVGRLRAGYKDLTERVKTFEVASGVTIQGWESADKIGAAVRLVREHGPEAIILQYDHLAERMKDLAARIEKDATEARAAVHKLQETHS